MQPFNWHPARRADNQSVRGSGGAPVPTTNSGWETAIKVVFWSWNWLFVSVALCGITPLLAIAFVIDTLNGTIPVSFLVAVTVMVATPVLAIVEGYRSRNRPWRLLALLYGVEVPVLAVTIVRTFLVREITTQLLVASIVVGAGLLAFMVAMWLPKRRLHGAVSVALFPLVGVLGLATCLFALLLGCYGLPILVAILGAALSALTHASGMIIVPLVFAFAAYFATIAIAAPFAAIAVYWTALKRLAGHASRAVGTGVVALATVVTAVLAGGVLKHSSTQPHERAFALLAAIPTTDAERTALLGRSDMIRSGLLDAYLAPYRYTGTTADESSIATLYDKVFGGGTTTFSALTSLNDFVLAPFLFHTDAPQERIRTAAADYAEFFDEPLESAEAARINEAVQSSFQRRDVAASLLDRNAERVRVREQHVTVVPHGDWADVELHEEYINVTPRTQEILYHFELPESGAITGLWLGATADKARADVFTVAPRGAAQKVYRQEVQRRADPALLEQVGPRQYRLRVFPILPETSGEKAQPMHMWMSFSVLRSSGHYPMPHLTERRNAFFNVDTKRTMNGAAETWSAWLPANVSAEATPAQTRVVGIDGFNVRIGPKPAYAPVTGLRVAIVVDRTRSMEKHDNALTVELASVTDLLARTNTVELVLPASSRRGESVARRPFGDVGRIVYYGGQPLSEIVRQSASTADLTIVLTDDAGLMHEPEGAQTIDLPGALWLVHLDGQYASAYADSIGDLLERPLSGAASTVAEAVEHYSAARRGFLVDGEYGFSLTNDTPTTEAMDSIAARAVVGLATQGFVNRDVHRLAVEHHIVTQLSSMLVLVEDRQREALASASAENDAFDRETETGTAPPPFMNVTGVPEPEEWLLIGIGAAIVLVAARKRSISSGQPSAGLPAPACVGGRGFRHG